VGEALIRPVRTGDVGLVALELRPADLAEVLACGAVDARDALEASVAVSTVSLVALLDDRPLGMFGVAPDGLIGSSARAWLLTCREVDRHPVTFFRLTRQWLEVLLMLYPCLWNWVDARYTSAVSWLERLGFQLRPAVPHGPGDMLFRYACLRREP